MKKILPLLLALAFATAAEAFSFSAPATSGQTLYFTITNSNNVKAVAPASVSWSGYTAPTGALVIPATVNNGGTTYNVTEVDRMAFQECYGLTSVTIPGSVVAIGTRAFSNDTSLVTVVLMEGVQRIDMMAFSSCSALTNIQLPSSLTRIAVSAFDNTGYFNDNTNWLEGKVLVLGQWVLKVGNLVEGTIVVPDGIRGIANSAFLYCRYMEQVVLPSTLQIVGEGAFQDCYVLDTMHVNAVTPPSVFSDSFLNVPLTMTVAVPCSTAVDYEAANYWNAFNIVEICDTQEAVAEVELPQAVEVTAVAGGVVVNNAEGMGLVVCDMAGRRLHTVARSHESQFLPLMAAGIYVVLTSEGQSLKFNFCK